MIVFVIDFSLNNSSFYPYCFLFNFFLMLLLIDSIFNILEINIILILAHISIVLLLIPMINFRNCAIYCLYFLFNLWYRHLIFIHCYCIINTRIIW